MRGHFPAIASRTLRRNSWGSSITNAFATRTNLIPVVLKQSYFAASSRVLLGCE